jgi:hypothetical protein
MSKHIVRRRPALTRLVAIGVLVIGLGLLFAATPQSRVAQLKSRNSSQTDNARGGGSLIVVSADVKDKTIQFGDALDVLITFQNQGKEPITIPADALVLKNDGWVGFPGLGSGLGESALIRAGYFSKEPFTLQPGESVAMTGSNIEMAVKSMGPMKAEFIIETADDSIAKALGKPPAFTVSYYVAPSKLIASAWTARTSDARQQLQAEFREALLIGAKETDWRDRFFAENTLTFMGCYSMPLLESAMKDADPAVRKQAVSSLSHAAWSAGELNAFIADLVKQKETLAWIASVEKCDEKHALLESIRLATAALADSNASVRVAAIAVLTQRAVEESSDRAYIAQHPDMSEKERQRYDTVGLIDPTIPLVQKMTGDADPGVRAEAQKFLSTFASQPKVAGNVAVSLADADAAVRKQALEALKRSPEPPPMSAIEKAFASATGEVALGLIELMFEREDAELAARLAPGFKSRTPAERLMILTSIAGHADEAALKLVELGLKDSDTNVRRAALMRLLGFPNAQAIALIKANSAEFSPQEREVAAAVQREIAARTIFPFLGRTVAASENIFPSREGTGPLVSPDGKWIAYVETGWGRPGGSGGMGRSNLLSITHVVRSDGSADRIVSDMFLVGWMADSRRVATARDGFAAIVDLNGKVVKEFGEPLEKPSTGRGIGGAVWPKGELRHQFGSEMPHTKGFQSREFDPKTIMDIDYGEDAAFSPDGQWFGPRRVKDQWQFLDAEGQKSEMKPPADYSRWGSRAVWSPDGAHVLIIPLHPSNSGGRGEIIETRKALALDFLGQSIATFEVDQVPSIGGWDYRKGRWNPWSKDGKHIAFVRRGQVWVADDNGSNGRQVTFDAANKVFPTFSPDGTKLAYITWQFDERRGYMQLGPTDLWVVDLMNGLATRVTHADAGRIEDLDWLGENMLIYDRIEQGDRHSSLRTASLR